MSPSGQDPVCSDWEIPFITPLRPDRLTRAADWTSMGADKQGTRYGSSAGAEDALGGAVEEEGGSWSFSSFVESRMAGGQTGSAATGQSTQPGTGRRSSRSGPATGGRGYSGPRRGGWGGAGSHQHFGHGNFGRRPAREASVVLDPASWTLLDEVEFSRLSKLSFAPEDPLVVAGAGSVSQYEAAWDRTAARQEKPLGILERTPVPLPPIASDTILLALAEKESAAGCTVVLSSDITLSVLMAASRSVIPWDFAVQRHPRLPSVLVFDKREGSNVLDLVQVNECRSDAPPDASDGKDSINSAPSLAVEATRINYNLPALLSAAKSDPLVLGSQPSSSSSDEQPEGIRYVRWELGDGLVLLVRGRVGAYSGLVSSPQITVVKALLEYDWGRGGLDWRQRLDAQRAAVLAAELKSNSAQLARWIFEAVLSSADVMKLAFVSRLSPRDRTRHAVLGVQELQPHDFAHTMGFDLANGFGIVKTLSRKFLDAESSFVVMRDPQKPLIRIYQQKVL